MKFAQILLSLFLLVTYASADAAGYTLIGHWRYSENDHSSEYIFRTDGTFTGDVRLGDRTVWQYAGIWTVAGGRLSYQYTQSSLARIPVGTTGQDKIIEISADRFLIETADGSRHTYFRVDPPATNAP